MFAPPLYKQRYQFVVDFVRRHKPKKVIDLGCADCSLLKKLKFHRNNIELLVGVDIDSSVIKQKMYGLSPLPSEYLIPANQPLRIELYQGSVTEKEFRTRGFDLASCIELIEHLPLAEVETFSEVLFGYMSPASVIISTPNADFNHLLPGCSGLRHTDHKFEWTKADFQNWAVEVCRLYGYMVEFTGVGRAPCNDESVGFCSQIGVFYKDPDKSGTFVRSENSENTSPYKLLYDVVYPSLCDNNIFQRTLVNEVLYWAERIKQEWLENSREEGAGFRVNYITDDPSGRQDQDISVEVQQPYLQGGTVCVPLSRVLSVPSVRRLCGSLPRLQDSLQGESRVTLTRDALAVALATEEEEEETGTEEEWEECGGSAYVETLNCATEDWEAEL